MTDGEAMNAAIGESRAEEALLTELENFVQLQLRKKASAAPDRVPDTELEPVPSLPGPAATPSPYSGGTAPLTSF